MNAFLSSELEPCSPKNAAYHVIPVPYEASVSYGGGTNLGPQAILEASDQLELWENGPIKLFTQEAVDCTGKPEDVIQRVEAATQYALECQAKPVLLGGEHSITFGALRALKKHLGEGPDASFGVIQFDAHADLRHSYQGSIYSHASVMRRAVDDLALPLAQVANRCLCQEERDARITHGVVAWDGAELAAMLDKGQLPCLPPNFPKKVFISFDVDGLDPSIMPATGTPVPGGLMWYQTLNILKFLLQGRTLVGFDVVELAPLPGLHFADFTAASLTASIMDMGRPVD